MIVKPEMRGGIFLNAHPSGCAKNVLEQIDYVQRQERVRPGPKQALVIGSSTGYGLASRIVAAFGCGAGTIGVFHERETREKRTGSPGWYHSLAFEKAARHAGLYARNFNGDAFSDELKEEVVNAIQRDWGSVNLLVYSVVAPRRQNPLTGQLDKTFIKPIKTNYTERTYDFIHDRIMTVTVPPATPEEIQQTVSVLGGEDWEKWVKVLDHKGLIKEGFTAMAYSYLGPEIARPIYRDGTIGAAKEHLEKTAAQMDHWLKTKGGRAIISVNKAVLTPASSVIPGVSLYLVFLMKVMRDEGVDENCVQQIFRLFQSRLYGLQKLNADSEGRIRMDDLEMRKDIQEKVNILWHQCSDEELIRILKEMDFRNEFLRLYGFEVPGIDYNLDVNLM